jgi:hypothetical protein
LASAHHAKYTDAEVEAIITAELVNGQSIDNAIDALIATHATIATAHHTKTAIEPHATHWQVGDGGAAYLGNLMSAVSLPASDSNCYFRCKIRLPSDWDGSTATLVCRYALGTANQAYSGKWSVTTMAENESWAGTRVLNESTSYDFPAHATALLIRDREVSLTNLAADDVCHISFTSDANNGTALYVMDVWFE